MLMSVLFKHDVSTLNVIDLSTLTQDAYRVSTLVVFGAIVSFPSPLRLLLFQDGACSYLHLLLPSYFADSYFIMIPADFLVPK